MKTPDLPKLHRRESLFAVAVIVIVFFILPRFGAAAMAIGAALLFAVQVCLFPDRFRSRNGSLTPVRILIATLGLLATVVLALSFHSGNWN